MDLLHARCLPGACPSRLPGRRAIAQQPDLQSLLPWQAGYPGTKPWGTMWYTSGAVSFAGCTGWTQAGVASGKIDVEGGQSGSPMWSYDSQNGNLIRAIMCAGKEGLGL